MFRLFVLVLCMGCAGFAQHISSCRIAVPVSLAGKEGAALARDFQARDLKLRIADEPVGGDLTLQQVDRLTILVDLRDSARPTLVRTISDILAQLPPEIDVSVRLVGAEQQTDSIVQTLRPNVAHVVPSAQTESIYDALLDATSNFQPVGDAILVLTSGMETLGKAGMSEIRGKLIQRGVRLNTVLVLQQGPAAIDVLLGPFNLKELALRTGGSIALIKPNADNSAPALADDYLPSVLNYSSLEVRVPGGSSPHRFSVAWNRDSDRLAKVVAPDRVGPCPTILSAAGNQ